MSETCKVFRISNLCLFSQEAQPKYLYKRFLFPLRLVVPSTFLPTDGDTFKEIVNCWC